jgi:hypothetical protein
MNPMAQQDLMMPQTFAELDRWAQRAAGTDLVPKEYKGKPDSILVAVQYGLEIGLSLMQALTSIAVINGKPTLYGDALLALCVRSALCEEVSETPIMAPGGEILGYVCTAKRKGNLPKEARFTIEDAKRAKLWSKPGPWTEYPQRMLQMRARAFALRDTFPDVLKGIQMREEVEDYAPVIDQEAPQRTIGHAQQTELADLLDKTNTDSNSFLAAMLTGITNIEEIPTRDYLRLKNTLLQKQHRMQAAGKPE